MARRKLRLNVSSLPNPQLAATRLIGNPVSLNKRRAVSTRINSMARAGVYAFICVTIVTVGLKPIPFIYFQF